jgi:uncharacterized iron-regulated membrane protein
VASAGAPADAATILESIRESFPGDQIYGFDAPTQERPTAMAYTAPPDRGARVILIDPVTARILGELPEGSVLETLVGFHANLLTGHVGRLANGLGSMLLFLLCLTGAVIWWPGIASWPRALTVDLRRSWRRITWELHGAIGIWTLVFVAMWAATGVYFAAAGPIRMILNAVSPMSAIVSPTSNPAAAAERRPTWRELIARAQARVPDQHVFRVVPPSNDTAPFQVMFSRTLNPPAGPERLTAVYLDQYTGRVLNDPSTPRNAGDVIVDWIVPLHFGNFGGLGVKIAWAILGLAPALLAITGFLMWWSRVVRPRMLRVNERS